MPFLANKHWCRNWCGEGFNTYYCQDCKKYQTTYCRYCHKEMHEDIKRDNNLARLNRNYRV